MLNRKKNLYQSSSKTFLPSQIVDISNRFSLSTSRLRNVNFEAQELVDNEFLQKTNDNDKYKQPNRKRILLFTSKFYISLLLTLVIVISISQVFLFHYYVSINTNSGKRQAEQYAFEEWHCLYPGLDDILDLAQRFGVDLVVIDPDLVGSLNKKGANIGGNQNESTMSKQILSFSQPSKISQESTYKTIVHFTAINETSGGQPSLKLFHNALKNNGYITIKYIDTSQLMQPEVYRRASHLFDDMPLDGVWEHKFSHDSNSQHNSIDYYTEKIHLDSHEDEVSKIYTEFITHIFIVNRTQSIDSSTNKQICKNQARQFTVIHIFVLYNYDYSPSKQWIQPGLVMDEVDKHKLLRYNVHSFDFRIPIEQYYIHQKKKVISLVSPIGTKKERKKRYLNKMRILDPENGSLLSYINNTYIHCKKSQFNISGSVENPNKINKYLSTLDNIKPISDREDRELLINQLATAFHFMNTFSTTYGNFSFWITGATLLAYYKHCDLAIKPTQFNLEARDSNAMRGEDIYNLEIGLFSDEVSAAMLDDLSKANNIGIVMMSDLRKSGSVISFQFKECPIVLFNLYLYEFKKDLFQYYFTTRNSMVMSHKSNKRSKLKRNSARELDIGHHVFNTNDLNLCWTCLEHFKPFRVPCNVYEHLRRIYII